MTMNPFFNNKYNKKTIDTQQRNLDLTNMGYLRVLDVISMKEILLKERMNQECSDGKDLVHEDLEPGKQTLHYPISTANLKL